MRKITKFEKKNQGKFQNKIWKKLEEFEKIWIIVNSSRKIRIRKKKNAKKKKNQILKIQEI